MAEPADRGLRIDGLSPAVTVLPSGADGEQFRRAMLASGLGCLEIGTENAWPPGEGLGVAITTRTAFTMDIGGIVADAVIERGWLPRDRAGDLLLALHEATANALLHGNLQLNTQDNATPDGFIAQALKLTERLTDPSFGDRPLAVHAGSVGDRLEISVQDVGGGFDFSARPAVMEQTPIGRGLILMRAHCDDLRFEDGGRRSVLCFHPCAGPAGDD